MRRIIAFLMLGAVATGLSFAQKSGGNAAAGAASTSPVAPQPKPKSKEELTAVQAIFSAPDPDARIKAGEDMITQFADSEFKPLALLVIASSYEEKGDGDNTLLWAEKTLEADPHSYQAKMMIAGELARRTREHDLDRDEKLGRADSLVKSAQEDIQSAPRPRPDVTDDQWANVKQILMAQSYEVGGMVAMNRKNYDAAAAEFKKSIATGQPDPATEVRLAAVYNLQGKSADAIALLDQVLAASDLNPQIKAAAQSEKAKALKNQNQKQ